MPGEWRGCGRIGIDCFALTTLCEQAHYCDGGTSFLQSIFHMQMSQNHHQIKVLINCLAFRNEFIMHNASMIKKTAHLSCFLGVRQSRTNPVQGLLFGFNIITLNPHTVIGNNIFQKIFVVIYFLEKIFTAGKSLQFLFISHEFWHKFCWNLMHPKILH
jgi:hypothetical protein